MAGKKKLLLGADFRDESFTSKGKPRKRKANDAENTQQIDTKAASEKKSTPPKKQAAMPSIDVPSPKPKEEPKEAPPPEKKSRVEEAFEEDMLLDKEQARKASVIVFAIGLFVLLAVLIPGSEGWNTIHNAVLGLFGFASIVIPVIMIYSAMLIAKHKPEDKGKIPNMIFWVLIACTTIQVVFVGKGPTDGFSAYLKMAFRDGADMVGGGTIGAIPAFYLLRFVGRAGSSIICLLMIFVIALITSGKELPDFLRSLLTPFKWLWELSEKVQDIFVGDEDDDDLDDEFDFSDGDEEPERVEPKKPRVRFHNVFDDLLDDEPDEYEPPRMPERPAEPPKPVKPPKPLPPLRKISSKEQQELDEFSRMFDIPLPDEAPVVYSDEGELTLFDDEPAETGKPVNNVEPPENSDPGLNDIIHKAAEKKAQQDKLAADQKVEPTIQEPQLSMYVLPGLDLLTPPSAKTNSSEAVAEMNEKATKIVDTFKSFGVEVAIRDIYRGPSITRYEIQPGVGVKVSKIRGLEDDIALSLAAQGVRMEAPVPGKAAVGIEVPNINKDVVTLREILSSTEFRKAESKLAFAVGKDITGNAIIGDVAKMPHVIIAGTTGSGKSVCTRSIIMSILYNAVPDEVKLILIDPKMVEFKVFDGIPHLLIPIVTDPKKAAGALNWAVNEMMRRYNTFADIGANDLRSYNEIAAEEPDMPTMPQIVVFIDELADMMMVAGKEVEDSICRLAQMGRAAGMHLVVATQRPTTDVITGLIKANIPSRIALSVSSQVDSRTIIDTAGADKLLGNGDMLYMPIGTSKPVRIQGCFASTKDINETVSFIRSQASGEYDKQVIDAVENFIPRAKGESSGGSESGFEAGSDEELVLRAAEIAVNNGQVSTTYLQRKLKLGFSRAGRLIDELEERGIVGPPQGSKPRNVLMSPMQFEDWKSRMMEEN